MTKFSRLRRQSDRRSRSRQLASRTLRKFETLERRELLAVAITEFMADNENGLTDQDGDNSDWIEIHNGGNAPVDLGGWHLTDNDNDLTKWEFPATTLTPDERLIVFASGKDRALADTELHTNFQLSNDGEYLALVEADGMTIATEFAPEFATQFDDVSYGFSTEVQVTTLVDGSEAAFTIPASANEMPADWTAPDFDTSTWDTGAAGIGYDTGVGESNDTPTTILELSPLGYWRLNETSGGVATNLGTMGASFDAQYQNGATQDVDGPRPPEFAGFESDNSAVSLDGADDFVGTNVNALANRPQFTVMGWVRPGNITNNRVGLFGQNDAVEFGYISPGTIQLWTSGGGSVNVAHNTFDSNWHHIAGVGDGQNVHVYIDGQLAGSGGGPTNSYGNSNFNVNIGGGGVYDASGNQFTGDMDEVAVFDYALSGEQIQQISETAPTTVDFTPHIATDIEAGLLNNGTSVLVRHEFVLADQLELDLLELAIQYDDGFVAYLNGQEVARRNAADPLDWQSAATDTNPDSAAVDFELISITEYRDFLQIGENVLAIHAMNAAADNPDFLISAELTATVVTQTENPRYFVSPTPGLPNGTGASDLGPILSEMSHTPNQPRVDEPITVTVEVTEVTAAVANVDLHYRTMFGAETTIAMVDDGTNGDATAGDGIFTAVIPAGVAQPGELVRWYATASDTTANDSRWPLFQIQSGRKQSPEYEGTVVIRDDVSSDLPVYELFAEDEGAVQTRGGTRASMYYAGQLYDNIYVRVRGGSTASSIKKSLKFEFNSGYHFRFDEGERRVEELNLNTTYTDKAYIRQPLSFELYSAIGNPASLSFPVRLQQNNEFHSVAAFIEQPDDDMLTRAGLDPDGALYIDVQSVYFRK